MCNIVCMYVYVLRVYVCVYNNFITIVCMRQFLFIFLFVRFMSCISRGILHDIFFYIV